MKQRLFFFLIAFSYLLCSGQQGNVELLKLWSNTKADFSKKGQEAKIIATIAMDSKTVNPGVINRALANANRVMYFSREDVKFDSLEFYSLSRYNDSLDATMKNLLTQLDNDKQFALLKAYATFKMLYEAADKRVKTTKGHFNIVAQEYKSPYFFAYEDSTRPEVKF